MYKLLALLFIVFAPVIASAQDGQGEKVKCIIVDAKTFKPIKYARATIDDITDTTGRNGVSIIYIHGPVEVTLEADGYETTQVVVQPGAAKTKQYLKMYQSRRVHSIEN